MTHSPTFLNSFIQWKKDTKDDLGTVQSNTSCIIWLTTKRADTQTVYSLATRGRCNVECFVKPLPRDTDDWLVLNTNNLKAAIPSAQEVSPLESLQISVSS